MLSTLEYIGWTLCLFIAFLSVLASLLTFYLLYYMKRWNGYLQLVLNLTICQGIYDLSYFALPFFDKKVPRILYELLSTFGGISSTLWCNVIIYVTWKIVITLNSVNILQEHKYYVVIITAISTLLAIFDSIYLDNYTILLIYFLIKTVSMLVNVILYLIIMYKVYTLSGLQKDIITTMCGRLQYYCLVQIISRVGATWFQLQYGFRETIDKTDSTLRNSIFAAQFLLTPTAGIGYLIVFLAMQPEANHLFQELLHKFHLNCDCFQCCSCECCCCECCCFTPQYFPSNQKCCQYCWCSHPIKRRKNRKFRYSDDTISSTIEQRILDTRSSDVGARSWRGAGSGNGSGAKEGEDEERMEGSEYHPKSEIEFSESGHSYSSSFFVGDDQDLADELERLYREGKCSNQKYSTEQSG